MLAARPVRIKGVALDSVSAIAFLEPNDPINSSLYDSNGLTPANKIKKHYINKAIKTAIKGAIMFIQKLLFSLSSSLKLIIAETFS